MDMTRDRDGRYISISNVLRIRLIRFLAAVNGILIQPQSKICLISSENGLKFNIIRSRFKIRDIARGRGRIDFQDTGIRTYFEDLKNEPDKEIGPYNNFEMGSMQSPWTLAWLLVNHNNGTGEKTQGFVKAHRLFVPNQDR